MYVLTLRLAGLLQSWGEHSVWQYRDSATLPTKSGIIGMLGCALGYERGDKRLVELASALSVVVRADVPGVMFQDYHTVSAEYMMTCSGDFRKNGTIVSYRQYLQDAFFTVFLLSDNADLLSKLEYALKHPKWGYYLGRKCCIPSRPVWEKDGVQECKNIEKFVEEYPYPNRNDVPKRIVCEYDSKLITKGTSLLRNDVTMGLRKYGGRHVNRVILYRNSHDTMDNFDEK